MKNILRTIEQYVVPALLVATGIGSILFFNGANGLETQPKEMLLGGVCLVGAGLLMTPFFNKLLKKKVSLALGILLSVAAIALGYKVYDVIVSENDHRENKELADENTIQRLKDLRLAQEQHKLYNGVYTRDLDSLVMFLEEEVIPVPYRNGNVMEDKYFMTDKSLMAKRDTYIISRSMLSEKGLTEVQAIKAHYEVRDTSYISVQEKFFSDAARARKKLPPVIISELPFSPHGKNERFTVEGGEEKGAIGKGRKRDVYVKITDPSPYPIDQNDRVKNFSFSFGSVEGLSLDGNWRE